MEELLPIILAPADEANQYHDTSQPEYFSGVNNHFQSRFSATDYLNTSYKHPGDSVLRDFVIRKVREFFKVTRFDTVKSGESLKVLDYGCGPVIAHVISAAGIEATEIVLAEFTDGCRKAVQQWLDKDPSAWDWTPHIKYVVQSLEGNQDEREVIRREEIYENQSKLWCRVT